MFFHVLITECLPNRLANSCQSLPKVAFKFYFFVYKLTFWVQTLLLCKGLGFLRGSNLKIYFNFYQVTRCLGEHHGLLQGYLKVGGPLVKLSLNDNVQ